eukprot:820964_1
MYVTLEPPNQTSSLPSKISITSFRFQKQTMQSLRITKPKASISFGTCSPSLITPTCCLSPYSPPTPSTSACINIQLSTTPLASDKGSTAAIVDDAIHITEMSSSDLLSILPEQEDMSLERILLQNGYKFIRKTSDTLQGALYEAEIMDPHKQSGYGFTKVAIKQACKQLHQSREAEQDGFNVIVEEDIVKEATILKYLTRENRSNPLYIASFVEFFETEDHFYLVMEHAGDCNLREFAHKAHDLIAQKRLSISAYKKVVKFLFWQIVVMVEYIHSLSVCHLDLCLENIVLRGGLSNFVVSDNDGTVCINPNLAVKIVDFGLSEIFRPSCTSFSVSKWGLRNSFDATSPELYAELPFDGMKNDIWSTGVILYQLLTGQLLYTIPDEEFDTGFYSIVHGKMEMYLHSQGLSKCFGKKSLHLMLGMLAIDETKRIDAMDVLQSSWFSSYYSKYAPLIEQRFKSRKDRFVNALLPYYE